MKKNSFSYWFAHWCAYQAVAKVHGCWKWKFLFHDWYKPWLGLIWKYEKVREFHRRYSRHHPEGKTMTDVHKLDYVGMIIDWEASTVTKPKIKPEDSNGAWWVTENIWPQLKPKLVPLLKQYGFEKSEIGPEPQGKSNEYDVKVLFASQKYDSAHVKKEWIVAEMAREIGMGIIQHRLASITESQANLDSSEAFLRQDYSETTKNIFMRVLIVEPKEE